MGLLKQISKLCLRQIMSNNRFCSSLPVDRQNRNKIDFGVRQYEQQYRIVLQNTNISNETLENMRQHLLQASQLKPNIVDSKIMDLCFQTKNYQAGIMYLKCLKNKNVELNALLLGKYLKLFANKYPIGSTTEPIDPLDQTEIIETYEFLRDKYPYFDIWTSECCVAGLALTDRWKDTLEILSKYKMINPSGVAVRSTIAASAFMHREPDIGWDALHKILSYFLHPHYYVYSAYLLYCKKERDTFKVQIQKMFEFWRDYGILPLKNTIDKYVEICNEMGVPATYTTIKSRKCTECSEELSDSSLSENDYKYLFETFERHEFLGEDMYCTSTPQEILKFLKFVDKTKPYDVVIDALNMVHLRGARYKDVLGVLPSVVAHFVEQDKTVLVLGRKHLDKYLKQMRVMKNVYKFLVDDCSKDDKFVLYATLASGKNAKYVSLDLMRQNRTFIKDVQTHVKFTKWQFAHQCQVNVCGGKVQILDPKCLNPFPQKQHDSWHIASKSKESTMAHTVYFPDTWVCFKL